MTSTETQLAYDALHSILVTKAGVMDASTSLHPVHGLTFNQLLHELLELQLDPNEHDIARLHALHGVPIWLIGKAVEAPPGLVESIIADSRRNTAGYEVLQAHLAGKTATDIAKDMNLGRQQVVGWIGEAGHKPNIKLVPGVDDHERKAVIKHYQNGMSLPNIELTTGLTNWKVTQVLSRAKDDGVVVGRTGRRGAPVKVEANG